MTATFPNIAPEGLDEFRQLARECLSIVRNNDPGTLQYDWFMSADARTCVVREKYVDSSALLAHMQNVGGPLPRLVELAGGLDVEIYGEPTQELLDAAAEIPTTVYAKLQGM